jgi:hypothetical protein
VNKKARKRLQKALNHTNKVLYRLQQLRDMHGIAVDMELSNASEIQQHLLWTAEFHGVRIDPKGMPR